MCEILIQNAGNRSPDRADVISEWPIIHPSLWQFDEWDEHAAPADGLLLERRRPQPLRRRAVGNHAVPVLVIFIIII